MSSTVTTPPASTAPASTRPTLVPGRPRPGLRTQPPARPGGPARPARGDDTKSPRGPVAKRTTPRRTPFVLLVVCLLGGGLVALLLLNTVLAQGAFTQARLSKESAGLADRQQLINALVAKEQSPESLAKKAQALGMVNACGPTFISLKSSKVLGRTDCSDKPGAATSKPAAAAASSKPKPGTTTNQKSTQKPTRKSTKKTATTEGTASTR